MKSDSYIEGLNFIFLPDKKCQTEIEQVMLRKGHELEDDFEIVI